MLIHQALLFLFLVVKASKCVEEPNMCPACLDYKYWMFFYNNNAFFHEEYRSYARRYELEDHQCILQKYQQVKCSHSCLRIHLKLINNNITTTIGWYFDCSSEIVRKVPPTVPGIPSNLRNFTGDLQFVDNLESQGQLRVAFEFQFYSASRDVENAQQYYTRRFLEKKRKADEEECAQNRVICILRTVFNSKKFQYCISLMVVAFFMTLFFIWCCCPAKPSDRSPAKVAFTKFENVEGGKVNIINE